MNRKERRKMTKDIKHKFKCSSDVAESVVKLRDLKDKFGSIPEGSKVKINLENVHQGNDKRNKWVDKNKDNVFTVKYPKRFKKNPTVVEFKEDKTWLWSFDELTVVEE